MHFGRIEIEAAALYRMDEHGGDLVGCRGAESRARFKKQGAGCVFSAEAHCKNGNSAHEVLEDLAREHTACGRLRRFQQQQQTAARLCSK